MYRMSFNPLKVTSRDNPAGEEPPKSIDVTTISLIAERQIRPQMAVSLEVVQSCAKEEIQRRLPRKGILGISEVPSF